VSGGSKTGVITQYNPVFTPQNGTLTINSNVVTNYPSFSIDEINAFYGGTPWKKHERYGLAFLGCACFA
ncbi:MAG: hypothetical protein IIW19_03735, partial [Clostridia bacterium]|nr:hypothetical protein [Clostridia bacterium]